DEPVPQAQMPVTKTVAARPCIWRIHQAKSQSCGNRPGVSLLPSIKRSPPHRTETERYCPLAARLRRTSDQSGGRRLFADLGAIADFGAILVPECTFRWPVG